MKRTKLIIIGVVAVLLLVGSAYAAWASQTSLTVNAGSGELDVEIVKVTVHEVSDYVNFDGTSIQISENKKSALVNIENLYPGASASLKFVISNSGTIPVSLDKVVQQIVRVVDTETNEEVSDNLMAALNMSYNCYVNDVNSKFVTRIGRTSVNGGSENLTLFDNNKALIKPGERVIIRLTIKMKQSADESVENKLFKFTVTPFFKQGT